MKDFKARTVAGLSWTILGQGARQAITIGVWIVMARMFETSDFGRNGMVVVTAGFAALLAELALGAAIIQRPTVKPESLSAAFWIQAILGVALAIAMFFGAPWIAAFYREPNLPDLAVFGALAIPAFALRGVQHAMLSRAMDFRALARAETTALAISGCCTIAMALAGCGAISLTANYVIATNLTTIFIWRSGSWRPSGSWKFSDARELFAFAAPTTGTQLLGYFATNLDSVLIGRYIGQSALGVYGLAVSIVVAPVNQVIQVTQRVVFPAFARIQDDPARIRETYLRMTSAAALLIFPVYFGLCATARPLVLLAFGEKWSAVVPILQILCARGVFNLVSAMNANLFLALGRAAERFKIILAFRGMTILATLVGLRWGTHGVAWALVLSTGIECWLGTHVAGKPIGLSFVAVARSLVAALLCSAAMAAVVLGANSALPLAWGSLVRAVLLIPLGVVTYATLVHGFKLKAYRDLIGIAMEGNGS